MKIRRLLSAFAGIALGLLVSQPCPADNIAAAAPTQSGSNTAAHKLFLWKVSGDRGTVFLLGSVHIGTADIYPLPREIELAFEKADLLVAEIDLSKRDPSLVRQLTVARGLYTGGDRLENHISDRTRIALDSYLQRTGRQPAAFSLMKPWLVHLLIVVSELQRHGFDAKKGIDKHFIDEAVVLRKPVIELEGLSYQLDLLSGFPDDLQDRLLLSSLLNIESANRRVESILHAWRTGDASRMERVITGTEGQDPRVRPILDNLIFRRNANVAQRVEGYLKTPKTYFVVVAPLT